MVVCWLVVIFMGYFIAICTSFGPLLTYNRICDPDTSYCYRAVSDRKTYRDAWHDCHTRDMFLTMPKTQAEMDFIKNNITGSSAHDSVWIGVNDIYTEGDWMRLDQSYLNMTNSQWKAGEPNDNGGNDEDCVEIQQQGWNNAECMNTRSYICQEYPRRCTINSTFPYRYNNICFKLFFGIYTYDNAKSKCITDWGYLAMPKTSDVNQYLNHINLGNESVWLGLYAVMNRAFAWVDRDPLTYNTDILPAVATSESRFVYIDNNGNWSLDERIAEYSVICMYDEILSTTTRTSTTASTTSRLTPTTTLTLIPPTTTTALYNNGYCPCNWTDERTVAEQFRDLLIDKFSLSKEKRRRNCAPDHRLSAKCLGITGAFVIFCVVFIIVLNDLLNVFFPNAFIIKSNKVVPKVPTVKSKKVVKISKAVIEEEEWRRIVTNMFNNNLYRT